MASTNSQLRGESGPVPRHPPGFRAPHVPASLAALLRPLSSQPPRREVWSPPEHAFEIDCLRGLLPPGLLASAEMRAAELGIGADQVLIGWNAIDEETYVARLSRYCGVAVEDFAHRKRGDCPLADAQLRYSAQHMLLPLLSARGIDYVQAPTGLAARRLVALSNRFPRLRQHIRLTTQTDLIRFLMRQPQFADEAADGLSQRRPDLSAAGHPASGRRLNLVAALGLGGIAACTFFMPLLTVQICGTVLSIWFLLFNGLRLAGALAPRKRRLHRARLSDEELPLYSILIALYREGRSVHGLLRALAALDYPAERLDIKLVIEPDDAETRAALKNLRLPPHIQVIVAPNYGPRTKPKALNYALPFARGKYLAVFDAEDRPDAGQLSKALAAFLDNPDEVACVQASLCIDNTADSWLARMFTAEYAGQFDAFLHGFSQFKLPLPLGGSSNHFRTDILREVGGWDAYNVTEDADLGVRMARFGYRAAMFRSTTHEEAPAKFGAWLRQRTRWTKGWMHPCQLYNLII
ncbi:MAG: glycosyltransferase [Xanthobacteraceae bacterium]|nr:glycosyltransferase [Xanthobacteraceae bacterium]